MSGQGQATVAVSSTSEREANEVLVQVDLGEAERGVLRGLIAQALDRAWHEGFGDGQRDALLNRVRNTGKGRE